MAEVAFTVIRGASITTLAKLRLLNGAAGDIVLLLGTLAAEDGGGGLFRWDETSTTGDDDGLTTVVPASPRGRWRRVMQATVGTAGTVAQINSAITAMAEAGGGVVQLAAGATYADLAAPIRLKDGVTLDLNGATLVQDPDVAAFRMVINDDVTAGNERIAVINGTLDGAKQNLTNATPWTTGTAYVIGDEVFNQVEVKLYVCTQAGTSAAAPTGTGTGIVDGTVLWNYVCPLWVPGADLVYFTRCRDSKVAVTVRNSRNDGVIVEGSVDVAGANLCHGVELDVRVSQCNKGGVYLSSAAHVTGRVHVEENFMGLVAAASRWCDLKVTGRSNTQACGLVLGRDARFCSFDVNIDGINTVVEHISSAPLRLHGRIYPAQSTVTVTPNTTGATAAVYWVVAKNADGEVLAVSTTASGTIANGNASPNNTVAWTAVAGAATYDVLKRVAGVPELLAADEADTSYTDLGGATVSYDYARAYTTYAASDCTIRGLVRNGVVVLRKSFRNDLDGLKVNEGGSAPDVSSPHAIDLQGASDNMIHGCVVVDTDGANYGIACETYVDPDFGETLGSNDNIVESCAVFDTRATPVSLSVGIPLGNLNNVLRHHRSSLVDVIGDPSTVIE